MPPRAVSATPHIEHTATHIARTRQAALAAAAVTLLFSLLACGGAASSRNVPNVPHAGPLHLDLFSARGFLGGSDYERYVVDGDILWRECGNVIPAGKRRTAVPGAPLQGDQVLTPDPQLNTVERRMEALSADDLQNLRNAAARVLEVAARESGAPASGDRPRTLTLSDRLPAPGSIFSLVSPGVFELSLSLGRDSGRFVTAVDPVAEREDEALTELHSLFSTVRGIGPVICNAATFFGVGRGGDRVVQDRDRDWR